MSLKKIVLTMALMASGSALGKDTPSLESPKCQKALKEINKKVDLYNARLEDFKSRVFISCPRPNPLRQMCPRPLSKAETAEGHQLGTQARDLNEEGRGILIKICGRKDGDNTNPKDGTMLVHSANGVPISLDPI